MTLRIEISTESEWVVFTLTGRIQADNLPELQELLTSKSSNGDVVLDLKNTKLVDRDAVRFLAQCEAGGVQLRNCAAYIRDWIAQEKEGMSTRLRTGRSELRGQKCGLFD